MNLKEKLIALQKSMQAIVKGAEASGRDLTDDEITDLEAKGAEALDLKAKIERGEKADAVRAQIKGFASDDEDESPVAPAAAKSLGEHFLKSAEADGGLGRLKSRGATIDAPEFKAATDVNTIGGSFGAILTDVDKNIVHGYRRPTVADVFGAGTLSGNAITYYIEAAVEGNFATVAEGGQKPQIHIVNPTPVTETLEKIAAWWDNSDEMIEDAQFMVSEINQRGVYLLTLAEENQLLNGDGTGSNLSGGGR